MVKAGLIIGAVMFLLALGLGAVISPFCTPCAAILAGLAAGYLAGVFDKPLPGDAIRKGAIAGAIAAALAVIGQIIAGVINASFVDPNTINQLLGQDILTRETLWIYQLAGALCIGLMNTVLMAGLGAAGGALWRSQNKTAMPVPPTYPPTTY